MRLELQNQQRPYAMDLPCASFSNYDMAALRRWAEKLEQQLDAARERSAKEAEDCIACEQVLRRIEQQLATAKESLAKIAGDNRDMVCSRPNCSHRIAADTLRKLEER